MSGNPSDSIDNIEHSYEYLVAFASQEQETATTEVTDHIKTIIEELQEQKEIFQREADEDTDVKAFFEWADEQTTRTLGVLELFLRNEKITPESVKALLSLPSFRNCLTILLFLEEIGEI